MTTKTACGVFGPIEWSRKDTAFTVEEIKEHNAAGVEVCGWSRVPALEFETARDPRSPTK